MNNILQILKTNKQKITYLALGGMLMVSFVVMVGASHVAEAAAPSITIAYTDADSNSDDEDTARTKTTEKIVTATDGANNQGTVWRYKKIASDVSCDASAMSSGTSSGNTVRLRSESDNGKTVCFKATNGSDIAHEASAEISGIDRGRPDAPTALALSADNDSGDANDDGITSQTTGLTITGCAEASVDGETITVELLVDGRSFNPAVTQTTGSGVGTKCTASGTSEFSTTIDLAERVRAYTISARATDLAGNTSSVSRSGDNATITVDTTAPKVDLTHRLTGGIAGERDDNGTTYLNEGDTVTVTMAFTDQNGMSEAVGSRPTVTFLNDATSLGTDTPTTTGNTRVATYTVGGSETVASGDLKYDITNESSIVDKAGNQLVEQDPIIITNTVVDTTTPTVGGITFATTNEHDDRAAESDEITATMTFSEKISEKTANTGIFYRLGTSGSGQRFTFANGRNFVSGQCQETSTANEYLCKYTVQQGDAGAFQVAVDKFADYAGNAGAKEGFTGEIITDTGVAAPSAVVLARNIKGRDTETAPSFVVTVGESGGTVTLYSEDQCADAISEAVPVEDSTRPFTVTVTTLDYENDGSDDGTKTVYAIHEDAASNASACSTANGTYTLDTSAPTVNESATKYYSDASVTQEISLNRDGKGRVAAGSSIYTKVVFDEEVKYRPGSSESALPAIKYTIGDDEHRYRIVSHASALSGGRCKPTNANNISNTYICQYRVRSNDVGTFALVVDTTTEDLLVHPLEEVYTHPDSIMLDSTAPTKPSVLDLSDADDSGDIVDDNVTNQTTNLTIAGCAETDSTVQLYANGIIIANATDIADDSSYTCVNDTDNGFRIDISLTEGEQRVTAKATDTSGNTGDASDALTITIDTTAPTATLTDAPTGANNVDTLDVTVGGADVTHYQHYLSRGNSCASANYLTGDTEGTAVADKITDSTPTQDGSIILCVVGRDKAGNWQTKANATTATWARDTTGPAKPINLDLAAEDDSGKSDSDDITNKTTGLTITGCAEEGSTVELYRKLNGNPRELIAGTVTADGTVGCDGSLRKFSKDIALTATTGNERWLISAEAIDVLGNKSVKSDNLSIRIKPALTTGNNIKPTGLDLAAEDDSGKNDDNVTSQTNNLTISGELSRGSGNGGYVQLYDGATIIEDAVDTDLGANGAWEIVIALTDEGSHTLTAKWVDVAGNEGAVSDPLAITIDTTGPVVSVTQQIVSPTNDTTPDIKIRTNEAGTASFGGACADTSNSPTVREVVVGENTLTLPTLTKESDPETYDDCTVIVTDVTGNESSPAAIRTFVVDNSPPIIASAAFINVERTETKITLNEQVYAPTAPIASDFQIEIDGAVFADLVTGVSGFGRSAATATRSFTLTHTALEKTGAKVRYTKGTNHVFDLIGNTLESFTGSDDNTAISATRFIVLALDAVDDTGRDKTDSLTRFDGDEVSIKVSLDADGSTFTNADRIRIFMGSGNREVGNYVVSSVRGARFVQAGGEESFVVTIPKSRFSRGVNTLSATYTPAGTGQIEGSRGSVLSVTYDTTAPTISVRNPQGGTAAQKVVRATDGEAEGETTWKYKVLTDLVQVCNEAFMETGAEVYVEGEDIVLDETDSNGDRVCLASEDAAGNVAYKASSVISGIDGAAPTVVSVAITTPDSRTVKVTLSEPVYAATVPDLADFSVVVGGTEYQIRGLSGFGRTVGDASDSFSVVIPVAASTDTMTLKYTPGTHTITDTAGNALESFDGQNIGRVKLVSLDLDEGDDTGSDATDDLTRFDGDEVTLTVSLSEGYFENGDMVKVYVGSRTSPVRSYTVSDLLTGSAYKRATGATEFSFDLPKNIFSSRVNNLSATYMPNSGSEGVRGSVLAVTYDITAPTIRVQNPDSYPATQKVVRASDTEDGTVWKYKKIAGTDTCDASALASDAEDYTEGSDDGVVLRSEDDNGMKICFSSTDKAGNTAYAASRRLSGVDTTAPTVSAASISTTDRDVTKISFSEPVYASSAVNSSDFKITSGQGQYAITQISGLSYTAVNAKDSVTVNHIPVNESTAIMLQYTKSGNVSITDRAGNILEDFTQSIANTPFVTLAIDAQDDTGGSSTDGITHFDGDTVSLTVSLTSGTFTNGDHVQVYAQGAASSLKSVIVSPSGRNTVNAHNRDSFVVEIEKRHFAEGVVTLHTRYVSAGRIGDTRGPDFSFTYDNTAPTVRVNNPDVNTLSSSKQVSAEDTENTTTTWAYKFIDSTVACDAESMASNALSYTEGDSIDLDSDAVNNKKVCFSSADVAGNTTYADSVAIEGVDAEVPTIVSASVDNYERTRTLVLLSEPVYAASRSLPASDFRIEIDNAGYGQVISGIESLPTVASRAQRTLVLTHPPLIGQVGATLTYTKGSRVLVDAAGNSLESFTQSITETSFAALDLADKDDLGRDSTDNYTRLTGSPITLTVSLTNGAQFSNGDIVRIYKGGGRNAVKTVRISPYSVEDSVNAGGTSSFTIELLDRVFAKNAVTALSAGYTKYGTGSSEKVGGVLRVTVDTKAPSIVISDPGTGAATQKVLRATASTSDDTDSIEWHYKQIAGDAVCDATSMTTGVEDYTEGEDISYTTEEDNGTKVCFSAVDLAGNVSYAVSENLVGIDAEVPTVAGVAVTGRDVLTVTTSEPVYSRYAPSASDFVVFINDVAVVTDSVDGISRTAQLARDQFTLTLARGFVANDVVTLSYVPSTRINRVIKDVIGNPLQGFDKVAVILPATLTVTLDQAYDSGTNNSDGVTNFGADSSDVAFTVTLGSGTYKDGDRIRLYRNDEGQALKTVLVGIHPGQVDARGQSSIAVMVPKTVFSEGAFTLRATYASPQRGEGLSGTPLAITYDATVPTVVVTSPNTKSARSKTISADDADTATTVWKYKQITSSAKCDVTQMVAGTQEYVEGDGIVFNSEDDNNTKACFSATDLAGNTGYERSSVLKNIDTTAPAQVTVVNPDMRAVSTHKKVSAHDDTDEELVWTYQQLAGDAVCDRDAMTNAKSYTERAQITFNKESDNGTKVCFAVTDEVGNVSYYPSAVLANISESASTISIAVDQWIDPLQLDVPEAQLAQAKVIVGTDGNDIPTEWFYRQIAADATCDTSAKRDATPYTEGAPIVLDKESDNGTKICFLSIDEEGTVFTAASEIISGIDTAAPAITITDLTTDPAKEKVVRAYDYDTNETVWTYKQITDVATCTAAGMSTGAQPYTESADLTFTKESDNDTAICFSVVDVVGNTAYAVSDMLVGIDATVPTVSSAMLVDVNRTQTKVVVAGRVRTFASLSASSFTIEIDGTEYPVSKVSGFEQSTQTQDSSFILTHAPIVQGATATLSYTARDTGGIMDAVGNTLESFSGQTIFDKAFVTLSLDAKDDTGVSATDGITRFDGKTVTLIASISNDSFSNGDRVRLYKKGRAHPVKEVLISGGIVNAIDVHGQTSFAVEVPKSVFTDNEETDLYTVFIPADGSNDSGQKGIVFTVLHLTNSPRVTLTTNEISAAMVVVRAYDESDEDATAWQYKQIAADAVCAADTLSGSALYTEGADISFTDEESNDTKACFASVDLAGNTTYVTSKVIAIDLTAPAITVKPLTSTPAQTKIVRANDNDDEATVWKYRVIEAGVTCDERALRGTTRSYKEGSGLKFGIERANGHKICFSSTDAAGNVLYAESMVIRGIDRTAPTISVTTDGGTEKTVRATDADTAATSWKYRVIKGNVSCAAEAMQASTRTYREGSGLIFRNARANDHKVCFAATDRAGNVSYRSSNVMQGIGAVRVNTPSAPLPSTAALQNTNRPKNVASPLTPLSTPLYPITHTNTQNT